MNRHDLEIMRKLGLTEGDFHPSVKKEIKVVELNRLEYDLMEMTYADTEYRILEDDGTITIVKGEY